MAVPKILDETGVLITRFDFCEAQAGNGACDRMAATIKNNVRRYVNEGHDCETSADFVKGAKSTGSTTILAGKLNLSLVPIEKLQWSGIKKFNNVQYEIQKSLHSNVSSNANIMVRATIWRAFGIGIGKQYHNLQTIMDIDPFEPSVEHRDDNWKFDGISSRHSGKYFRLSESISDSIEKFPFIYIRLVLIFLI